MRSVSWVRAALKDLGAFPAVVQEHVVTALQFAAHGEKADSAKPINGMDSGIYGIALRHRGNAYRVVYTVLLDEDVWVVHVFQKKSKSGIKTPKQDIDLIRERMKRLQDRLR